MRIDGGMWVAAALIAILLVLGRALGWHENASVAWDGQASAKITMID